ncbi:phosphopentomutase [Silvimonas terrae]|uniref:Phosphopentomutase n=1 Tax=Silvimonas terrae TaxID=300266 RepID=A0A840RD75_9NEIS|nr:phosphopentomutase [Silvimonas terrae]MBB5191285.1 phosphopentomutase [Silvimonas terrae]
MTRVFIVVIDSLGIGALPDADRFGDSGANTLLHIAQHGPLRIPVLRQLGLGRALALACGQSLPGIEEAPAIGAWAAAREVSAGKDTPSGHREMAGVPVTTPWGMFPQQADGHCFPADLLQRITERAGVSGWLGDCHASGTDIITRLGERHIETGWPIFYTSADSVFQVACHETAFGLERLYDLCRIIREEIDPLRIGRVIARPFAGADAASFKRTANRHDYTMPPPFPTLLERQVKAGGTVVSIGKIADIFAHQGISQAVAAHGTVDLMAATYEQVRSAPDNSIVMTNLVDFDQSFGHRRDATGYAQELELLDGLLPNLLAGLRSDDLLMLTADHGCDPTWHGSDHTREYVPILLYGATVSPRSLGVRPTFADLGQTAAAWLGLAALDHGHNMLA